MEPLDGVGFLSACHWHCCKIGLILCWGCCGPDSLQPLSVELGPGILENIFDGIQVSFKPDSTSLQTINSPSS